MNIKNHIYQSFSKRLSVYILVMVAACFIIASAVVIGLSIKETNKEAATIAFSQQTVQAFCP